MDNLTHTLAGAALAEAGLKRYSGLGTAALLIGANLPDLDAVAIPFGENFTFRRGWTHGPVALVLLPLLLTAALVGWDRWQARRGVRPAERPPVHPRHLLLLSAAAVLSHPFLDWLNSYGIRLLMPFDETWFYGDSVFIIDPWIWLALGAGVLLARGWSGRRPGSPGPARASLVAVGAYIALMLLGSRAARHLATRHMVAVQGEVPARVMAGPVPLNPLRRELIYDMGDHYRFGSVGLDPPAGVVLEPGALPTNHRHPAARAGMRREEVRDFLYWSRFPFFTVEGSGEATVLHVGDARFSRGPGGWASVSVTVSTGRASRSPSP